ncbi:hypothetical protein AB1Y20_023721 [Prymnesium parvum]|uniref:Kringle domain-containing protein n=1 Tax=Prymnesium parvum TaxID=97485 RepID=A0AB34JEM4_PRYPA
MAIARWVAAALAFAALLFVCLRPNPEISIYTLEGGETVALRSLHTSRYLQLDEETGQVFANAEAATAAAAQWQVLVLDTDTVRFLSRSASAIDARSERFTGRRTATASGCACVGYSNAHGFGRYCHPWEDETQPAWCYVSDNCSTAASRGSFGRRYAACDGVPEAARLVPVSGCNCSGEANAHGYGGACGAWEYKGQPPWCYLDVECARSRGAPYGRGNGSFGRPYEECEVEQPQGRSIRSFSSQPNRRRLMAPPKVAQLLASKPEQEQYLVLVSRHSNAFLQVEPPPHKDALLLTARGDELSIRSVFSSYERTHLILSLATNSLLNVCDTSIGEVCTGVRYAKGERLKLLRQPRRTARWKLELIR